MKISSADDAVRPRPHKQFAIVYRKIEDLKQDPNNASLHSKKQLRQIAESINTAIRKIWIALEDDSAQPQYLQTVVGRGYRFVAVTNMDGNLTARGSEMANKFHVSPEEFGQAIMAAAGLQPDDTKTPRKLRG